jgi:PAS domain S-box-containing protein
VNTLLGGWIIAAAAAAAAAAVIFLRDLSTPLGTGVPMLYALPIVITGLLPGRRGTLLMVCCALLLTWVGMVLSTGELTPEVLTNRVLATALLLTIGWLLLLQKQSARKIEEAQQARDESNERLRLAQSAEGFGTFDWDIAAQKVSWSPETERIWGLPVGGFEGTYEHWRRLVHPDDVAEAERTAHLALDNPDISYAFDHRIVRPDGSVGWIHAKATTVRDPAGRPIRVVGVNLDITERKWAEEALRRLNETLEERVGERTAALKAAEERFRGIFDHAAEGIAIRDLEGRYVQCNAAYNAIVGYTEHELEALEFQSLIHPDDRLHYRERVRQLLSGDVPSFELETRYITKSGRPVWVHKHASLLRNDQGAPTHLLVLVTNITQRKRDEEELLSQRARLENLASRLLMAQDEERRRIARELHDDHMQRMAVLALDLHHLSRSLPTSPGEAKAAISQYARSVEQLTTDLQQFAHGLHPSILSHMGLEATLHEHVEDFERRTGLKMEVEVHNLPAKLSDEQALCLFRVLQESLQNVCKHANASKALVRLLGTRRGVGLCVHDDGRGFEAAQESAGGRKGLGLISLRERLEALNGTFRLRTKPGDGTEVHAWIPLEQDGAPAERGAET